MLLSWTLGQYVGEASADTDTDVVGEALVVAEPLPCENAPLTELLTESCFSPRPQTAHDAVVQRHSYR